MLEPRGWSGNALVGLHDEEPHDWASCPVCGAPVAGESDGMCITCANEPDMPEDEDADY